MESLRKMKNWKKLQQSNSNKWKIGGNRKKKQREEERDKRTKQMLQQQQQFTTTAMQQIIGGIPTAATPNVTVNAPNGK
jgi:hypothetical protein